MGESMEHTKAMVKESEEETAWKCKETDAKSAESMETIAALKTDLTNKIEKAIKDSKSAIMEAQESKLNQIMLVTKETFASLDRKQEQTMSATQ